MAIKVSFWREEEGDDYKVFLAKIGDKVVRKVIIFWRFKEKMVEDNLVYDINGKEKVKISEKRF